jgi:hypothetical protein
MSLWPLIEAMKSSLHPASAMRRRNALRSPCAEQVRQPGFVAALAKPISEAGRRERFAVLGDQERLHADRGRRGDGGH